MVYLVENNTVILFTFSIFNLEITYNLTQAEIISADDETKNAYCRKVHHGQIQDYKESSNL